MHEVPAPAWFSQYRTRILGSWVALGVFGSSGVWASTWLITGDDVFQYLAAAGSAVAVLLVAAVITDQKWLMRKAAGAALLLHLSRIAAVGWQLVLADDPTPAAVVGLSGTAAVVLVLALQAGWLHWVAGLPDSVS